MKKLFLSLVATTLCAMGMFAQSSLVATLQHGSNIQAFYGDEALSAAHEAAVDGDIITLSSGNFKGCDISKAITLRGEGMSKTCITSYIKFTIPNGSAHTLFLEGIRFYSYTFYGTDGTEKVVVSKCFYEQNSVEIHLCNATIIQSIFSGIKSYSSNVTCTNSVIAWLENDETGRFDIQNCWFTWWTTNSSSFHHSTIKNSIIYPGWIGSTIPLHETNISSHCLVNKNINSGFADSWYVESWDGLFLDNYHLTEEAAATYLGTDGTQVGIYGGMYPYDETPDYPLVKTFDVIGSHKNGKLNVKINVK